MTARYICDRCGYTGLRFMHSIETEPLPDAPRTYGAQLPIVGHICRTCHELLRLFMEAEL